MNEEVWPVLPEVGNISERKVMIQILINDKTIKVLGEKVNPLCKFIMYDAYEVILGQLNNSWEKWKTPIIHQNSTENCKGLKFKLSPLYSKH